MLKSKQGSPNAHCGEGSLPSKPETPLINRGQGQCSLGQTGTTRVREGVLGSRGPGVGPTRAIEREGSLG